MLTSAKIVRAVTRDGEVRVVKVQNEEGKLKYNYILELARCNKLKYDACLKGVLIDLITNYKEAKKEVRAAYREMDELYERIEELEDEVMELEYELTLHEDVDDEDSELCEVVSMEHKRMMDDLKMEMNELH
ncbi:hypothetical protein IJI02_01715 [Candidatus Saccharibacteria bacterium]|nr:hypothetical protein [Candidatus Saccharibacteria bacterium]